MSVCPHKSITLYGGGLPGWLTNGESTAAAAAAAAAADADAGPLASRCWSSGEGARVRTISATTRRRPSADLQVGGGREGKVVECCINNQGEGSSMCVQVVRTSHSCAQQ